MWSFIGKKEKNLDFIEKLGGVLGDAWIWIAFDAVNKVSLATVVKRKIPRVFRHSNIKVSGLITLAGAPDTRIAVLYEQVLTPQGNDHSGYLNSI